MERVCVHIQDFECIDTRYFCFVGDSYKLLLTGMLRIQKIVSPEGRVKLKYIYEFFRSRLSRSTRGMFLMPGITHLPAAVLYPDRSSCIICRSTHSVSIPAAGKCATAALQTGKCISAGGNSTGESGARVL